MCCAQKQLTLWLQKYETIFNMVILAAVDNSSSVKNWYYDKLKQENTIYVRGTRHDAFCGPEKQGN